jgi:ATP-dependent RNA helicase DDX21
MLLFSATIPEWVKELSSKYMDPSRKLVNLINRNEVIINII